MKLRQRFPNRAPGPEISSLLLVFTVKPMTEKPGSFTKRASEVEELLNRGKLANSFTDAVSRVRLRRKSDHGTPELIAEADESEELMQVVRFADVAACV